MFYNFSIRAGRLLAYQDFLLYRASVGNQPTLSTKGFVVEKTNTSTAVNTLTASSTNTSELFNTNSDNKASAIDDDDLLFDADDVSNIQMTDADLQVESNVNQNETNASSVQRNNETKSSSNSGRSSTTMNTSNPNFVSEFYTHSRLHYISTWGAELKAYVRTLQAKGNKFEGRQVLKDLMTVGEGAELATTVRTNIASSGKLQRVIMHIDMDCFFVSVALRNRPDLIGELLI